MSAKTSGKHNLERFGRLKKPAAPEIVELKSWMAGAPSIEAASYYGQMLIHRAHTVMLGEEKIIENEEAAQILSGLHAIEKLSKTNSDLVSYISTESALIKEVGDVGGKMHIGRSRNDLLYAQLRIYYRDQVERLIGSLLAFNGRLIRKAGENVETVMPGYTHGRQAQPVTLAHYLLAHVDAAFRSIERLEETYRRTNQNTLGAAALAGTSWPVNRRRTTELLGFDGICENSQDSVASIDYVMELSSAIAIHMCNLSRLAADLQTWSSDEYAFIDLDEAYAGTSSIMPQKKNPDILEYTKRYSSMALGAYVSITSSMKASPYTMVLDRVLLDPVSIDIAVGSTNTMAGAASTLTPIRETMLAKLNGNFSTMTDLADIIVKRYRLSYRQAHEVVADVILEMLANGKKPEDIDPETVARSAEKTIGAKIVLSDDDLVSSIDPYQNVLRRNTSGGPAPDVVKKMISGRIKLMKAFEKRREKRILKVQRSLSSLETAENRIRGR